MNPAGPSGYAAPLHFETNWRRLSNKERPTQTNRLSTPDRPCQVQGFGHVVPPLRRNLLLHLQTSSAFYSPTRCSGWKGETEHCGLVILFDVDANYIGHVRLHCQKHIDLTATGKTLRQQSVDLIQPCKVRVRAREGDVSILAAYCHDHF